MKIDSIDILHLYHKKIAVNITTNEELVELEQIFRESGLLRECNHECNGNYQIQKLQGFYKPDGNQLCFRFSEALGNFMHWYPSKRNDLEKDDYKIISLADLKKEFILKSVQHA